MLLILRLLARVVVLWAALFGFSGFLWSSPVAAHTGFDSSVPEDGESVTGQLGEIVLLFSGEAEPVGDGFQVVSGSGLAGIPHEATSVDGKSWHLVFEQPLDAGTIGVRWRVQAPDAHPIEGSFSFVVEESVPGDSGASAAAESASAGATTTTTTTTDDADDAQLALVDDDADSAPEVQALQEFLEVGDDEPDGAGIVRLVGRILGLGGIVLGIGSLVFAGSVLGTEDPERRLVVASVAVLGLIIAAGTALDLAGRTAAANGEWAGNPMVTDMDLASVLRGAGGLSLAIGALFLHRRLRAVAPGRHAMQMVAAGDVPGLPADGSDESGGHDGSIVHLVNLPLLTGIVGVVLSVVFDGHTTTEGNRLLTGLSSMSHVLAGAVWVGGVVTLGGVVWLRHRRRYPLDAKRLGTRFSVVAAVALSFAGLTGIILSVTILDSVGEPWSTQWGRVLMAKSAAVLAAACFGAYNHYRVIPTLGLHSETRQFRRIVRTEALVLLTVVALTAILVAADST